MKKLIKNISYMVGVLLILPTLIFAGSSPERCATLAYVRDQAEASLRNYINAGGNDVLTLAQRQEAFDHARRNFIAECGFGTQTELCPDGTTKASHGGVCPPVSCPTGQQLRDGRCVDITCPTGRRLEGNTCVQITCPTGQRLAGNTCVQVTCPTGQRLEGNTCVQITCPTGQRLDGNACVQVTCPTGRRLEGNDCVQITCPTGQRLDGNTCVQITCPIGQRLEGNRCVENTCPVGQHLEDNQCVPIVCPVGQHLDGSICVDNTCPLGQHLVDGRCVQIICPVGKRLEGYICVNITCPDGQHLDGNSCVRDDCKEGYERNNDGKCVKACKADEVRDEDGKCVRTGCKDGYEKNPMTDKCEKECDKDDVGRDPVTGKCIEGCKDGKVRNPEGKCVNVEVPCPVGQVRGPDGKCAPVRVDKCGQLLQEFKMAIEGKYYKECKDILKDFKDRIKCFGCKKDDFESLAHQCPRHEDVDDDDDDGMPIDGNCEGLDEQCKQLLGRDKKSLSPNEKIHRKFCKKKLKYIRHRCEKVNHSEEEYLKRKKELEAKIREAEKDNKDKDVARYYKELKEELEKRDNYIDYADKKLDAKVGRRSLWVQCKEKELVIDKLEKNKAANKEEISRRMQEMAQMGCDHVHDWELLQKPKKK